MKTIIFPFLLIFLLLPVSLFGSTEQDLCSFSSAFSAGYVFKHDHLFKEVYGHGIVNIITADGCYYPWEQWGIGAKISYWRAHGRTTFLHKRSLLQEVPLTFYLRKIKDVRCNLQLYASLGGGVIWIKEKSYLGDQHLHKGIGEAEIGMNYLVWRCLNFTSAFRYLFPRQKHCGSKMDVGGFDLRAGIEFQF